MLLKKLVEDDVKPAQYSLPIIARDLGVPARSSSATLLISVSRNKYAPMFSSTSYDVTFKNSFTPGLVVTNVKASDADDPGPNSQIKYSIIGDSASLQYYTINADTGDILLTKSLSGSLLKTFTVVVQASDQGLPPKSTTANVFVTIDQFSGQTGRPSFASSSYAATVSESDKIGTSVITLTATNKDCSINYDIVGDGLVLDLNLFRVDITSGLITINAPLTSDPMFNVKYKLRVQAKSTCNPDMLAETLLSVTVVRNKNAPVYNNPPRSVRIGENLAVGSVVANYTAFDPDSGQAGVLVYSINAANSQPQFVDRYFFVTPTSGQLLLLKPLSDDPDKSTKYTLSVVVTDRGVPPKSSTTIAEISVKRNMKPPAFGRTSYSGQMDEGFEGAILTVSATDEYSPRVKYSLVASDASAQFLLGQFDGILSPKSSLEDACRTQTIYNLIALADDQEDPSLTSNVSINVRVNHNVNTPIFAKSLYSIELGEYSPLSDVLTVSATDKDATVLTADRKQSKNGVIKYYLSENTNNFMMNENRGSLQLIQPLYLDRIPKPTLYNLTALAQDGGTPPRSARVQIVVVVARNQFSPRFVSSVYRANVNSTFTYDPLLSVTAVDDDATKQPNTPNSDIRYYLDKNDVESEQFSVNPKTGAITWARQILPRSGGSYKIMFRVYANDSGIPQMQGVTRVELNIQNVNSASTSCKVDIPIFAKPQYIVETNEIRVEGTKITSFAIIQNPKRLPVVCSVKSSSQFYSVYEADHLGAEFCALYNSAVLSLRDKNKYEIDVVVQLRDGSNDERLLASFNSAHVLLIVMADPSLPPHFLPTKDFGTLFLRNTYIGAVHYASPPATRVMQINAQTYDLDDPNGVIYDVSSNSDFVISADSGILSTSRAFGSPVNQPVQFLVYASVSTDTDVKASTPAMVFIMSDNDLFSMEMNRNVQETTNILPKIINQIQGATNSSLIVKSIDAYPTGTSESCNVSFVAVSSDLNSLIPSVEENKAQSEFMSKASAVASAFGVSVSPKISQLELPKGGRLILPSDDGVWIALICFTVFIIFFTLVAVVFTLVTFYRLKMYIKECQLNKEVIDFIDKSQSDVPVIETPGSALYVMPDEATAEALNEMQLPLAPHRKKRHAPHPPTNHSTQHRSEVNPIFHSMASNGR